MTNSSPGDFKIFNFVEDFMITNPILENKDYFRSFLLIYLGSFEVSVR